MNTQFTYSLSIISTNKTIEKCKTYSAKQRILHSYTYTQATLTIVLTGPLTRPNPFNINYSPNTASVSELLTIEMLGSKYVKINNGRA